MNTGNQKVLGNAGNVPTAGNLRLWRIVIFFQGEELVRVAIKNERMPALQRFMPEVALGIPVDGDDGRFPKKHFLGLFECAYPLGGIFSEFSLT